jgi:hypothetical protein
MVEGWVGAGLLLTLARVLCSLYFLALLARVFSFALGVLWGGLPAVVVSQRWVAAALVSAGCMLAKFFITISHCAWRHFISLSDGDKETKQRKRLSTICIRCPSVQTTAFGSRVERCSLEPRFVEPLLLANPDIPTLRHQCSRASSNRPEPARSYARGFAFENGRWDESFASTQAIELRSIGI